LANPETAREVSRAFDISALKSTNGTTAHLATTGREGAQADPPTPNLKLASDLMGMRIVNQKQEKIGEVWDLLVSFGESRPAFVIISSSRLFRHGHQYAVPLDALNRSDNKLVLNADVATLDQAPFFDEAAWNSRDGGSNSVRVYRYATSSQ
jgi:hypothetical protein